MVQVQPALAGGASIAALLAGIESHGAALAIHPQGRELTTGTSPAGRELFATLDPRLWRDAVPPQTDPVLPASFLLTIMSL